jgi:hypothetical protein
LGVGRKAEDPGLQKENIVAKSEEVKSNTTSQKHRCKSTLKTPYVSKVKDKL